MKQYIDIKKFDCKFFGKALQNYSNSEGNYLIILLELLHGQGTLIEPFDYPEETQQYKLEKVFLLNLPIKYYDVSVLRKDVKLEEMELIAVRIISRYVCGFYLIFVGFLFC